MQAQIAELIAASIRPQVKAYIEENTKDFELWMESTKEIERCGNGVDDDTT